MRMFCLIHREMRLRFKLSITGSQDLYTDRVRLRTKVSLRHSIFTILRYVNFIKYYISLKLIIYLVF